MAYRLPMHRRRPFPTLLFILLALTALQHAQDKPAQTQPARTQAAKTSPAQTPPSATLLVLSKSDRTLAIVDPNSRQVLVRIPVGNDPHEVIASTDGKTAYVSNYGFGAYNTLAVVDLVARKALPSIDLGPLRGPHGLTFVGGKVWFTAETAKAVGSYDPATHAVDWILGTGQNRTHMIYVAPDLQRIVTTNVSSSTVSIIEKSNDKINGANRPSGSPPSGPDWNQTVVRVGNGSEGFDVSPDGKEIWVANSEAGTISIVDVAHKWVTQTVDVDARGANRLKFTPDGKRVLISTLDGPELVIMDAATHKAIRRIAVGTGAAGIVIDPYGSLAFVACLPDDYVAVIDLRSLQVIAHIDAGANPDGMAWVGGQ